MWRKCSVAPKWRATARLCSTACSEQDDKSVATATLRMDTLACRSSVIMGLPCDDFGAEAALEAVPPAPTHQLSGAAWSSAAGWREAGWGARADAAPQL